MGDDNNVKFILFYRMPMVIHSYQIVGVPVVYGIKLVNTVETKPLCASSPKLGRHAYHGERMSPIGFGGQGSAQWTFMEISV